jgi:indole-3-glycerol phosphate synthase
MNILEKIIAHKKEEIVKRKSQRSIGELKASTYYSRKTFSLKQFLLDENKTSIIAEFKRKSPSKGVINGNADVVKVTKAYTEYGASCLSVLTDEEFFGGKDIDLLAARVNNIPILRKDFIIDEYQIVEAKSIGADVILLIAACMTPERARELAIFAKSLQLEVLLEIHDDNELQHICDEVHLVGINNRNLKTFKVDINTSIDLGRKIPKDKIKIAESGISDFETINLLKEHGFKGFLIGENFMKMPDPGLAFKQFAQHLKL